MTMRHVPVLKERRKSLSKEWQSKIFLGPVKTQKAYLNSNERVYTVKVHPDATKIAIKKTFEEMFEIKPVSVNTTTLPGKLKNYRRRVNGKIRDVQGKTSKVKKAMIKIPADANFNFDNA